MRRKDTYQEVLYSNVQCNYYQYQYTEFSSGCFFPSRGCCCIRSCRLSPGYYRSSALNERSHPWLLSRIPIQLQVFSSYLLWCYIASGCATGDPPRVSSAYHVLNSPWALGSWLSCRMVSTSQDCMSPGTSLWETMPYHLAWSMVLRDADRICLVIECADGRCHFHKQD